MLTGLIAEIDDHLAWRLAQGRPLAESTFGRQTVNDGKLVGRLRGGAQVTVATMDTIRAWMRRDRADALGVAA